MKKDDINYLITGILAIGVIILFVLHFRSNNSPSEGDFGVRNKNDSTFAALPIAYIRVDSLMAHYNFSQEVGEKLIKKYEDSRLKLHQRENQLRADIEKFQQKVQNNAFLSRESAESEHASLMKKQENLQRMEQELSTEFAKEQQKLN
ncbi:MAG: OmpH family outer membrane protein, partial [Bacteroidales bacterium]|nr:OmpH family outer membrane protein [Bacteroidales bacterium]